MTVGFLADLLKASINNSKYLNKEIFGFSIDTRTLKKNECFIALKEGHKYLANIKKCVCVIVDNDFTSNDFAVLKVNDTKETFKELALYFRNNFKGKVIGITGSNGKTTTKELLASVLNKQYKTFKSYKNNNNDIGIPLNLFKLNNTYKYAVFELGMNHAGEIRDLVKIVKPNIALITNIGTAHIGNLGSKNNIYKAKMEISDNNILFVNGLDKYLKKTKNAFKVNYKNIDFEVKNIKENKKYIEFDLYIDKKYHIKYHIPSKEQLTNVLLVIAVALYLKVRPKLIVKTLNHFKAIDNRMDIKKIKKSIIINDAYNSNYESLMAGLNSLKCYQKDKICIIGDILELGDKTKEIYKKITKKLKELNYKYIFVGQNTFNIKIENSLYFNNVDELINYYFQNKQEFLNKVIYIKGSNGINLLKFANVLNKH